MSTWKERLEKTNYFVHYTAKTDYYFRDNLSSPSGGLPELIDNVILGIVGNMGMATASSGVKSNLGSITQNNFTGTPFADFLQQQGEGDDNVPKGYMTWLFFDENFNFIPPDAYGGGSGSRRVERAGDCADPLVATDLRAPKNGYVPEIWI